MSARKKARETAQNPLRCPTCQRLFASPFDLSIHQSQPCQPQENGVYGRRKMKTCTNCRRKKSIEEYRSARSAKKETKLCTACRGRRVPMYEAVP